MRTSTTIVAMTLLVLAAAAAAALALAIAFGGPGQPPPMHSMSAPFKAVDFSSVPAVSRFLARDGTQLAYRAYPPSATPANGSVVLIHGSASRSVSMHPLADGFARAGYAVYALDVRGHGESGAKGRIGYIGQLEDDLAAFLRVVQPPGRRTLIGFSAGGGFALRFAGSARGSAFDDYVLLAPFIHQDAPTSRPGAGGWAAVGLPRIIALRVLNAVGVTALNDLPVLSYALGEREREFLTPQYSYALALNFRPRLDYRADIDAVRRPMAIVAGEKDEVFFADRYGATFEQAGRRVPVTVVPGIGHIDLVLTPAAVEAVVSATQRLAATNGR